MTVKTLRRSKNLDWFICPGNNQMLTLIPLITEALRLVNNLLEGIPIQDRQAQARIWFLTWWPLSRGWLKILGVKEEDLKQIEDLTGKK